MTYARPLNDEMEAPHVSAPTRLAPPGGADLSPSVLPDNHLDPSRAAAPAGSQGRVPTAKEQRQALAGSIIGSTIEWYDFLLYGTIAPLIFAPQYFPSSDPFVAIMLAYLGNALTFFIRPFGGVFFAHIGDRIGRKKTLVITLTMMGAGTMLIGCLPTYAQIGVWAPALLFACRILQGLAIGGEWGGALLLAYEYAPANRRGLFGAIPQTGVTWGLILGNLALLATMATGDAFTAGVWRIPFIASVLLIIIGLWIRRTLDETPAFAEVKATGQVERSPLLATLRHHGVEVLVAIGVKAIETAPFYIFATFMVSYATSNLGFTKSQTLAAILLASLAACALIPLAGAISDRVGRVPVYVVGVLLLAGVTLPYFWLHETRTAIGMTIAAVLALGVAWSPVTATLGTMMSELFDAKVRYTGITLGYQIGAALFSGTAPMLATWMVAEAGGAWWPICAYILGLSLLSLAALGVARARARRRA